MSFNVGWAIYNANKEEFMRIRPDGKVGWDRRTATQVDWKWVVDSMKMPPGDRRKLRNMIDNEICDLLYGSWLVDIEFVMTKVNSDLAVFDADYINALPLRDYL